MFVVHDWEKFVNGKHLAERLGHEELLGSLQRQHVAECPVGVVRLHQVVDVWNGLLLVVHLHPLPADVAEQRFKASD